MKNNMGKIFGILGVLSCSIVAWYMTFDKEPVSTYAITVPTNISVVVEKETIPLIEETTATTTETTLITEPTIVETEPVVIETVEPSTIETTEPLVENNEDDLSILTDVVYTPDELQYHGVLYWGNYRWTWYSERVLPGGGLVIPGRHADENGYICDENDYMCIASSTIAKGTIVETPFGKQGKIYDCGCAVGTMDVYVNW